MVEKIEETPKVEEITEAPKAEEKSNQFETIL